MMERYLNSAMGHERIKREPVVGHVGEIWTRVLYGVG